MGTTTTPPSRQSGRADLGARIRARHEDGQFDTLADSELIAAVADGLSIPRMGPADSFVLHAPLELTARASLLPFVLPRARPLARLRLTALLDGYERTGPGLTPAPRGAAFDAASLDAGAATLLAAVDAGDLEMIDGAASWLGRAASPHQLRQLLSTDVLPRLAAAAHAPIFLFHLARVAPRGEVTAELLRGLARELGRQPGWRLGWVDDRATAAESPTPVRDAAARGALFDAIAETPLEPEPERSFIFPTMTHVDQNGTAAELLGTATDVRGSGRAALSLVADRGREVLRAAAWSMLLEPDDHSPYGWSHCLTLPQAALGIAPATTDPGLALAVAATYVVGFRNALAHRPLVPVFERPDPGIDLRAALADDPLAAAAAVWHAAEPFTPTLLSTLATHASSQHDAHLVKYTLACIDAAANDPAHARLFLAAAAHLNGWWVRHGNPEDPLQL